MFSLASYAGPKSCGCDFCHIQANPQQILPATVSKPIQCLQKNIQGWRHFCFGQAVEKNKKKVQFFKLFFFFLDKTTIEWSKDLNSDLLLLFKTKSYVH